MCTTCGCGSDELHLEGKPIGAPHRYVHAHDNATETLMGRALGAVHEHGVGASRSVQIEADILAKNDAYARDNRHYFAERAIFALNVMSSPGSGKTSLLERTIAAWGQRTPIAVVEGDQRTSRDADRIRAAGARAVQINTGKGCHLDAHMVGHAIQDLAPAEHSLLLIENVGNLVCPAAFDLGEAQSVVILSVTEGDDKPLKYPDMFHAADLMLINKIDLLPYVDFDVASAVEFARRVRPELAALSVSARTGEGFDQWIAWLERGVRNGHARRDRELAAP
jgi:hydrogenase nickel incorporation protein HypB